MTMFQPEIKWHYFGKLRYVLEDMACEQSTNAVISELESDDPEPICLFVPTAAIDVFCEALLRRFKAASFKVFATALSHDKFTSSISTVYKPEDSNYRLSYYHGSDTAFAEQLKANTFFRRLFKKADRGTGVRVVLAAPSTDRYVSADTSPVEKCRRMARIAEERGYRTQVLPEPGLSYESTLEIVRTAPSRILDGSHKWERDLERQIAQAAESSPIGRLIQSAWRDLKSGVDRGILVKEVFKARVASLGELAEAHPWATIISLWSDVLYGLESDIEYSGRWYKRIEACRDGWLKLDHIHDILLYESSIYGCHALIDPACISYLVAYHGSRWLQLRMAAASLFGGGGGTTQIVWE